MELGAGANPSISGVPPPENTPIVGGRICLFAQAWKDRGANFWQLRTVRRGMTWTFHTKPTLTHVPIPFVISNPTKQSIMKNCIDIMLEKGAIERVSDPSSLGWYSLIFLKPKKNGDLRPIIDLSGLNKYIKTPSFKMESAQSVKSVLTKNQWLASIDMSDAYFHIAVRKSFRKYLRFATDGEVWQFKAMPFGLSVAP